MKRCVHFLQQVLLVVVTPLTQMVVEVFARRVLGVVSTRMVSVRLRKAAAVVAGREVNSKNL